MQGKGTYTWFGYVEDFNKRLSEIKRAGFDTVCTFWDRAMESSDARLEDQIEICESFGLTLEHSHLPYYGCNLLWDDNLASEAYIKKNFIEGIDAAATCGLKTLVMHAFETYVPDEGKYDNLYKNMKMITDYAYDKNVRIAIENLGETTCVRRIINDLIQNPTVGLCFDAGHNNVTCHNDYSLLEEYSKIVFALHIHDNNSKYDQHMMPFAKGCNVDWKLFMEKIEETTFTGSLMLESSYPIDYATMGEADEYVNPAMDMRKYLRLSSLSCDRIYRSK